MTKCYYNQVNLVNLDIIMKFQYYVSLVHPNVFFHLPECLLTIVVNALYKHWDYFLRSGLSKCGHLLASTTTTPITTKTTRSSLHGIFWWLRTLNETLLVKILGQSLVSPYIRLDINLSSMNITTPHRNFFQLYLCHWLFPEIWDREYQIPLQFEIPKSLVTKYI